MRTKIDIRRAITERGYTITSFCQKFDLKTQNIIQNYIKGNPTIKRLEDLCEKLDCDITDLFYPIDGLETTEDNVPLLNNENEERNKNKEDVLTSSLRHPKIFIKEFGDFLMPCHQHSLSVYILVQR